MGHAPWNSVSFLVRHMDATVRTLPSIQLDSLRSTLFLNMGVIDLNIQRARRQILDRLYQEGEAKLDFLTTFLEKLDDSGSFTCIDNTGDVLVAAFVMIRQLAEAFKYCKPDWL